jgi:hypothetical protein
MNKREAKIKALYIASSLTCADGIDVLPDCSREQQEKVSKELYKISEQLWKRARFLEKSSST